LFQSHGTDVFTVRDEANNGFTLMHYAAKLPIDLAKEVFQWVATA